MKKLLILLALAPFSLLADVALDRIPNQIERTQSTIDRTLKGQEAIYEFQFVSQEIMVNDMLVSYTIDGKDPHEQRSKDGMISIQSTTGKRVFRFYFGNQFAEVRSDSLMIEALHRDKYSVMLHGRIVVTPCKPVIYLYPQLSTDVTVKIDINGEDTFLYPTYTDSWKFTAHPNGDLDFGEETYNYLFWESTTETTLYPKENSRGFLVEGQNIVPFLEDKLTRAVFTSKEQADFITFWGPILAKNQLNFVSFEFNETCEKYAKLDISPTPDNLYRIFMVWQAVEKEFPVIEQEITPMDRTGFSVLEWGGMELNSRNIINQPIN